MTYLYFVVLYFGLPALILALTQPKPVAGMTSPRVRIALPVASLVMFIYAMVLSNYLVFQGVRWYEPGRTLATLFHAPLDEYLLFSAVPLIVCLVLYQVLGRTEAVAETSSTVAPAARVVGCAFFAVLTLIGASLLLYGDDRALYLGVVLVWAGPVLFGLWLYGGHYIWGALRRPFLITVGLTTVYVWIAVWAAVMQYIWIVSRQYTVSAALLRLPLEEALLFLLFILMVATFAILLLTSDRIAAPRRNDVANTK